jgi:hypothetical protein
MSRADISPSRISRDSGCTTQHTVNCRTMKTSRK